MDELAVAERAAHKTAEQMLLEVVEATLRDLQPAPPPVAARVTLDSSLDRDLGLDSLARVELLLRIERAFGVDLPEDTLQRAETVRDLLNAVTRGRRYTVSAGRAAYAVRPEEAALLPEAPAAARKLAAGDKTGAAADDAAGVEQPTTATTLLEVLDWHLQAHAQRTQIICLAEDAQQEISYGQLAAQARAIAAGLQHAGLQPHQTVAIMLPTSPEYFYVYFGVLIAGGIPVPIYPPARASQLEEHVLRHAGILANAQAALLVTVPEAMIVARLLQARVPGLRRVVTPRQLSESGGGAPAQTSITASAPSKNDQSQTTQSQTTQSQTAESQTAQSQDTATQAHLAQVSVCAEDIAFIQYTSGSTGNPKGVMLTHANLLANIRAMQQALAVSARDVFVSWLPLYHDLGLIGAFLGGLYVGYPLVVMSPLAFLSKPERWLWAIHRYRGTLSAAPNFAYELCLRRIDDAALEGLDLSSWRMALNGAEAVSADTVQRFAERFARYGLRTEASLPVYGLAEASLGLLFPTPGRPPLIDRIQREPLARTGRAVPAAADDPTALRFVACGHPIPGHAIRLVDERGQAVGARVEGRLEFQGPSATHGYFNNPEQTARLFDGGWLDSGDRAYAADGEVYLTGRVKDIVIRGGRHIYPEEIEQAVGAVDGVRKGCVAVFGSRDLNTGTERLVVLAETRTIDAAARAALRDSVARAVLNALGEPPDDIVLAPPHTVLKTSSGKLRRSACRALYEEGRIGHAAGSATAGRQVLRLVLGAVAARLRLLTLAAARALFGVYAVLVFVLLAPPLLLATLLTRSPTVAWRLAGATVRMLLRLTCIPLTVRGLEHLPRDQTCVLVSNHASYLDGLILVAALPAAQPLPYAFVAKRELRDQLITGKYLEHLGAEFVERFDVKRSVEDANRMTAAVAHGRSLVVFPEGTFVERPGLLPFRLGAFLAAASTGAPVVPVAIRGSRDVLPDGVRLPRPGALTVEIGAPLPLSLSPKPRDGSNVFATAVRLREAARGEIAHRLTASD